MRLLLSLALMSFIIAGPTTANAKSPAVAAALNFFLPGTGYLYNGERPLLGAGLAVGALGLTYVEQSHVFQDTGLKDYDSNLYNVMFGAVFIMNTVLAIDAYREAETINSRAANATKAAHQTEEPAFSLAPVWSPEFVGAWAGVEF